MSYSTYYIHIVVSNISIFFYCSIVLLYSRPSAYCFLCLFFFFFFFFFFHFFSSFLFPFTFFPSFGILYPFRCIFSSSIATCCSDCIITTVVLPSAVAFDFVLSSTLSTFFFFSFSVICFSSGSCQLLQSWNWTEAFASSSWPCGRRISFLDTP
ncbi:uncharacterized protein BDW43DRAFT_89073 [Aspergillus alliaceus]|uniref:uncharacterized protein n=1 Tax=Petromyces alliaceus TaxID=209559 RepID=UPI0012A4260E|nr:uncharacterized protein BDW43DRAFT_89073 [Aspergillus alliaceus]KAB8233530.1 hypothetical protein BDW43DRAFT_89073 [Aspergillus alliaceus]